MPIEAADNPVKRATTLWRHDALMNRHERRAEAQVRRDERESTHIGRAVKRHAFTINEFCWSHGISRATYYNLKARSEAPDEMRVLGKVLITEAAAAKWRKRIAALSV